MGYLFFFYFLFFSFFFFFLFLLLNGLLQTCKHCQNVKTDIISYLSLTLYLKSTVQNIHKILYIYPSKDSFNRFLAKWKTWNLTLLFCCCFRLFFLCQLR